MWMNLEQKKFEELNFDENKKNINEVYNKAENLGEKLKNKKWLENQQETKEGFVWAIKNLLKKMFPTSEEKKWIEKDEKNEKLD